MSVPRCGDRKEPNEPFSRRYFDALLAGTEGAREGLPKIIQAGEAVAERLVGGEASSSPAFARTSSRRASFAPAA